MSARNATGSSIVGSVRVTTTSDVKRPRMYTLIACSVSVQLSSTWLTSFDIVLSTRPRLWNGVSMWRRYLLRATHGV
jgi:hypothetical protein